MSEQVNSPQYSTDQSTRPVVESSKAPRNRLRGAIAGTILAGVIASGCAASDAEADIGRSSISVVEQESEQDVVDIIAEPFSYSEQYNPTAVLSESEPKKQAIVDEFMADLLSDAEIRDPYYVDGFFEQILENDGDTPFDRAAQVALFTVNDFKGTTRQGSGFLSLNETDARIQLSTIEHTAESGLETNDKEFDPSERKIMHIPGLGGVDMTESFSSFLKTTNLRDEHDDYVEIDLPVMVQDALQVLSERGEIAPLEKASAEELSSLSVGDTLTFANIYGGGQYGRSTVTAVYENEIETMFDLSFFGVDASDKSDEEVALELEASFKHDGQIFNSETFANANNIARLSCNGNSGSPLLMTTASGEMRVVAAHSTGVSTSQFTVYAESSNAQEDDDSLVVEKNCGFRTFASLIES